jgi:hypothetical protein
MLFSVLAFSLVNFVLLTIARTVEFILFLIKCIVIVLCMFDHLYLSFQLV